jgi:predicted AAA+ superfamily ATPase
MRDVDLRTYFWKDYEKQGDRRTSLLAVDFVAERTDGTTLPIEVKFRRKIDPEDLRGLKVYLERLGAPQGILVTRDHYEWRSKERILCVPLLDFLLLF